MLTTLQLSLIKGVIMSFGKKIKSFFSYKSRVALTAGAWLAAFYWTLAHSSRLLAQQNLETFPLKIDTSVSIATLITVSLLVFRQINLIKDSISSSINSLTDKLLEQRKEMEDNLSEERLIREKQHTGLQKQLAKIDGKLLNQVNDTSKNINEVNTTVSKRPEFGWVESFVEKTINDKQSVCVAHFAKKDEVTELRISYEKVDQLIKNIQNDLNSILTKLDKLNGVK